MYSKASPSLAYGFLWKHERSFSIQQGREWKGLRDGMWGGGSVFDSWKMTATVRETFAWALGLDSLV